MKKLKIPKPPKKINWDKKLWNIFSMYIRLRDSKKTTGGFEFCKCITCYQVKPFADIDAGHCFRRGKLGTKYDEHNNHGQCRACNRDRDGEFNAYKHYIRLTYGQKELDRLEFMSQKLTQLKDFEMQEMCKKYQTKIDELKGQL